MVKVEVNLDLNPNLVRLLMGDAVVLATRGCGPCRLPELSAVALAQDTTLMRLLARDELMTLGADERDIDWRAAWSAELAKDDQPTDRRQGARERG